MKLKIQRSCILVICTVKDLEKFWTSQASPYRLVSTSGSEWLTVLFAMFSRSCYDDKLVNAPDTFFFLVYWGFFFEGWERYAPGLGLTF